MWQPPFNTNLYRFKESDLSAIQASANSIHLQNLKLYETLPPLKQFAADLFTANIPPSTAPLVQNSANLTQNHLPQYLRSHGSSAAATISPYSSQWSTAGNNSNGHLLLPTVATSAATDVATLNMSNAFLPPPPPPLPATTQIPTLDMASGNFLTPPPPPAPLPLTTAPQSTTTIPGIDILTPWDLYIMSECFMGIMAARYANPTLAQTLPFKEGLMALNSISTFFTKFLTDPLKRSLFSPQQLNLFQQYLTMEQHELQKYSSNNTTVTSCGSTSGYFNNSINLNQPKSSPTISTTLSSSPSSSSATSTQSKRSSPTDYSFSLKCQKQHQQQHINRKRKDDLIRSNSFITVDIKPSAEALENDLLPPPKKKWIRHYLKANNNNNNTNHQLHVQNNNNSMMVDEIPPTQQQHHPIFGTNSSSSQHSTSSQHSPPRNMSSSLGTSGGSHYMHMINSSGSQQTGGAGSGANHVTHATPRRRTISSTSNGAGTREVHNKLEKNRRAHLKECYEALKNQLSLKDEDRRKTSNLAILGEALKCVQSYLKREQELDAEWEHLANDKINLQKRFVSLKRELGPKYEQIFSGIFPDNEISRNPSERETINDTHSLSSGRGSTLYSSSSSLSSGGSNGSSSSGGSGSNTMSSPVGAGLQTAMPTTISPVINKINNNIVNSTSPISINSNNNNVVIQQQQQQHRKNPTINTTIQAVTIPTPQQGSGGGGGGINSPPAGSPTALVTFGSSLPLSLTAKNISATAVTRGSPTPSTPSPSPSSSSGVSSSSSLISSSPPINGVISNSRNVTVNIPNGLKLQSAGAGLNGVVGGGNGVGGNGSSTTAATILATSASAQGVNNTNNAVLGNQQQQQHNGRKKSLILSNNNNNNNIMETNNQQHHHHHQQQQHLASEDGEQPAKFLKVFNTSTTNGHNQHHHQQQQQQQQQQTEVKSHAQKLILSNNGGILSGSNGGGGGGGGGGNNNNLIGGSLTSVTATINKSITNGGTSSSSSSSSMASSNATVATTNELCRLPGGAELNILPSNGLKVSSGIGIGAVTGPVATAFYHANGKITFVNGPPPNQHQYHHHQQQQQQLQHPPSPLPNSTTITSNGTTTLTNGILLKDATSVTPLLVSAASSPTTSSVNGLHFAGNFAQLLAAANNTSATTTNSLNNNNGSVASATSIVPMATNFQNIAESKTKTNNKSSIATWRSGTATTN